MRASSNSKQTTTTNCHLLSKQTACRCIGKSERPLVLSHCFFFFVESSLLLRHSHKRKTERARHRAHTHVHTHTGKKRKTTLGRRMVLLRAPFCFSPSNIAANTEANANRSRKSRATSRFVRKVLPRLPSLFRHRVRPTIPNRCCLPVRISTAEFRRAGVP